MPCSEEFSDFYIGQTKQLLHKSIGQHDCATVSCTPGPKGQRTSLEDGNSNLDQEDR